VGTPGKIVVRAGGKRGILSGGKVAVFDGDGDCLECCGGEAGAWYGSITAELYYYTFSVADCPWPDTSNLLGGGYRGGLPITATYDGAGTWTLEITDSETGLTFFSGTGSGDETGVATINNTLACGAAGIGGEGGSASLEFVVGVLTLTLSGVSLCECVPLSGGGSMWLQDEDINGVYELAT
jgi:hypothetical protein